jgi:SAM-dependent methyltransferase
LHGVESPPAHVDEDAPERFSPDAMHGRLIEAEHLARYRFAEQFVAGKRVLDAGCGTAYGSASLAAAGARSVTGVDADGAALDLVRPDVPAGVELVPADIRDLPFDDAAFDVVVCFETIEHVETPEAALDELARVLAADGLLVISSPNRAVYPPGNPHHHHEYLPEELEAALGERLANVRLFRQHDWLASAVLDDAAFAAEGDVPRLAASKAVGREPGTELYTVALASDGRLPSPRGLGVLTQTLELRELSDGFDELARSNADLQQRQGEFEDERSTILHELERLRRDAAALTANRAALTARLVELETEVAGSRQAAQDAADARAKADAIWAQFQGLQAEIARLAGELDHAAAANASMRETRVWRLGERFWGLKAKLLRRPAEPR